MTQNAIDNTQNSIELTPATPYLIPLQQQGLLNINGPDAAKFLQGQVTCDVRELEDQQSRIGAQCNIKGRMLLCFRALLTHPDNIILRMHSGLINNGLNSLGKYIVFSKAKLANISNDYRCIGVAGSNAGAVILQTLGVTILQNDNWQLIDNNIVIRINEQRYECWLAADNAQSVWLKLASHCHIAKSNIWALLNIQDGLGDITPETVETFTPQAINLQLVNGINFRKGCYTGQEIVARLHYRGSLKRHMYRFEFTFNNELPLAGSSLHNSEGKNVGEVVIATDKNAAYGELLASVIDDQCVDIFLPNNTQKLSLLPLPYAIPILASAD